jgi:hypothetical protein
MLIFSLFFAQKFSKSPLQQIGQIGPRGRRWHSWNESTTGGCGGRFFDWWIFGGSVWIRAAFCLWDLMAGTQSADGEHDHRHHESSGENLFACIAVVGDKSTDEKMGEGEKKSDSCNQTTRHATTMISSGILGYDSNLGGFGPLCLAPIRASVFLIGWCSVCSFLILAYNELAGFAIRLQASGGQLQLIPSLYRDKIGIIVVSLLHCIHDLLSTGGNLVATKSVGVNAWLPTFAYATAFILLLEIILYLTGKICMILKIYVPRGVSHPGGARPHKITRTPKWLEGKEYFLSQQLLSGDDSSNSSSRSSRDDNQQHDEEEVKSGALSSKWRCAVAHDSHRDTIAKFNYIKSKECEFESSTLMTGEPYGRQIWTLIETQPPSNQEVSEDDMEKTLKRELIPDLKEQRNGEKKVDNNNILGPLTPLGNLVQSIFSFDKDSSDECRKHEETVKLIETLASGGRTPMSFDPSKNPNSCDQIFRAQMISYY